MKQKLKKELKVLAFFPGTQLMSIKHISCSILQLLSWGGTAEDGYLLLQLFWCCAHCLVHGILDSAALEEVQWCQIWGPWWFMYAFMVPTYLHILVYPRSSVAVIFESCPCHENWSATSGRLVAYCESRQGSLSLRKNATTVQHKLLLWWMWQAVSLWSKHLLCIYWDLG